MKTELNILKLKNLNEVLYNHTDDLDLVLPELVKLNTQTTGHKNNYIHTLGVLKNVCEYNNDDLKMKIVALLHDIGKIIVRSKNEDGNWTFHNHEAVGAEMVKPILKRFNITNPKTVDYIYKMVKYHGRVKMHRDVTESAIRRLDVEVGQDIILDLIEFCKCDITTKFPEKRERIVSGLETIKNRILEVRTKDKEAAWRSPITGHTIMNLLGTTTGRIIGDIKSVTDSKIKSGEWTEKEAIEYVLTFKK